MEDTTMKKTYIIPELVAISLKMNQHLLDGSPTIQKSGEAGEGSFGSGSNLGRSFDFTED